MPVEKNSSFTRVKISECRVNPKFSKVSEVRVSSELKIMIFFKSESS